MKRAKVQEDVKEAESVYNPLFMCQPQLVDVRKKHDPAHSLSPFRAKDIKGKMVFVVDHDLGAEHGFQSVTSV